MCFPMHEKYIIYNKIYVTKSTKLKLLLDGLLIVQKERDTGILASSHVALSDLRSMKTKRADTSLFSVSAPYWEGGRYHGSTHG